MLWVFMALMCLAAAGFATRALLTDFKKYAVLTGVAVVFVTLTSFTMYRFLGSPDVPSGAGKQPDVDAMVATLAARLEQQPDDVNGWKMLGRSYMALGNPTGAVGAFEKAVELESAQNAQTLVDFGVALAQADGQPLSPRAVSAFENALTLDPNHPEAMFYGGIAAFNRGDATLAADRWEKLLASDPPPEVRAILEQRIAAWRGEPLPETPAAAPQDTRANGSPDAIVTASVGLSDGARAALPDEATVFIIARDPAQPSPPIAVTRRSLSELPAVVGLGDRESMVPGRSLSGFAEFELIARVSVSGSPAQQPGDWFASTIVRPSEATEVSMSIDKQVR